MKFLQMKKLLLVLAGLLLLLCSCQKTEQNFIIKISKQGSGIALHSIKANLFGDLFLFICPGK